MSPTVILSGLGVQGVNSLAFWGMSGLRVPKKTENVGFLVFDAASLTKPQQFGLFRPLNGYLGLAAHSRQIHRSCKKKRRNGARYRVRTCDPYRVKVMLYH